MTELSGTLDGVGLPAIIRFLTGLKKTGCLRVEHADWHGEIVFDEGRLTGAALGSRRGLSALDGLVEALPGGSFTFDTQPRAASAPTIDLSPDALQAHLDTLAARIANGNPRLPSADAVPELIAQDQIEGSEDPLPLDRGTLQTLLAVDGRRSVREIVAQRGSFDALWQLGNLADVGLVRLAQTPAPAAPSVAASAAPGVLPPVTVVEAPPAAPANAPPPAPDETTIDRPSPEAHCPKLGFDDDPANSFGRPTRLHRCFAAATPLALSLDQQRELCLSDQFGTCPRLTMAARGAPRPPSSDALSPPPSLGQTAPRSVTAGNTAPAIGVSGRAEAVSAQPEAEDPRIVRLPFAGRNTASARGGTGNRPAASSAEPTQLRSGAFAPRPADSPRPTPLRARIDRMNAAPPVPPPVEPPVAGRFEASVAPTYEPRPAQAASAQAAQARPPLEEPSTPRSGGVPPRLIAIGAVGLILLAVVAYLVGPRVSALFGDDAELSSLPNASAVAAGTPVTQIAPRLTPAAAGPAGNTSASAATPATAPAAGNTSASAASAATAPAAPTLLPEVVPTVASQPATPPPAAPALDERFVNNARNWPSSAQGTAWLTSGSYRLMPRQAGQFVSVGVPIADGFKDVIVSATFRKLSGAPPGGGFGIIVRDQSTAPLDGVFQGGQYYVLEVGDKGEVGIWRRDVDHWVDLLPWQHAEAVRPGSATNDLVASAIGNRLSMSVNGTQVVTVTDNTLTSGGVGILAGGDGNQVAVDHLTVQTP